MGIVIKQSAYATIINYLGVVLGAVNIIFLYPAFLSDKEFGLWQALLAMGIVLSPFAQFGLARSTLRYLPRFNSSKKTRGRFLATILMIGALAFSLFLLIFQFIDEWLFSYFEKNAPELIHQYWLIVALAFLLMYIAIFESYYKALLNVVIPTFMREFFIRLTSTCLVICYYLKWIDFSQLLKLSVSSYAISLSVLIIILIVKKQFTLNFSVFRMEKAFLKEMVNYMLFIMAGAVGAIIVLQVDRLMVTSMLGLESNAVYVVAFFMASVIDIPRRSIAQMSDSLIAKAFEFERIDEVKKIYKQSSINQLILGCFVFLAVALNLDNIYEIMPKGEVYHTGAAVVIIIGISKLIDMGFGVNSEIIISSKLYKANIYFVVILAILTVGLNALLIPILGLNGAAYASLAAIFIFNLLKMFFIWRYLKVQPFSKNTLIVLVYSAICYLIISNLPKLDNVYFNTAMISIVICILFAGFTILLKPSKEITGIISKLSNKIKN